GLDEPARVGPETSACVGSETSASAGPETSASVGSETPAVWPSGQRSQRRPPLHWRQHMASSVPAPAWSASLSEHQRRGREVGRVLVLNATYEPINVCTVRRAVVLLLKDKAEMIERAEFELHSESCTIARPMVIRLVAYVRIPRD